jgi:hypothetical protein
MTSSGNSPLQQIIENDRTRLLQSQQLLPALGR